MYSMHHSLKNTQNQLPGENELENHRETNFSNPEVKLTAKVTANNENNIPNNKNKNNAYLT